MSSSANKPPDCLSNHQIIHLSHKQLISSIDLTITSFIKSDSLLNHLPSDISTEELEDMSNHLMGRSMSLIVERDDSTTFQVIVGNDSDVRQLKRSIERYFSYDCRRNHIKLNHRINWRFVWRTYCIKFNDQILSDDLIKLKDLGIHNNCKLCFIRKFFK
ncbi:U11/U12 small nuclear ribonucleoprotein 25 kDa protein-like [Oppia nitens]|uniref:U11/U12 small nuclear ribonucleoprotein 25 kDa protein-like n=1 Tax=Oppia nitens TaxID=1686743 RepID=UPI0023DC39FA|nr:U11/U12 small nuclear ribonucleoprotein 25 kDa protein-like [Oppia nitens]